MLKGVNRQVVEIRETDSAYFERVLFFVKPEFSTLSEGRLKSRAAVLLKNSPVPPEIKKVSRRRSRLIKVAELLSAAAAGAGIASAVFAAFMI